MDLLNELEDELTSPLRIPSMQEEDFTRLKDNLGVRDVFHKLSDSIFKLILFFFFYLEFFKIL